MRRDPPHPRSPSPHPFWKSLHIQAGSLKNVDLNLWVCCVRPLTCFVFRTMKGNCNYQSLVVEYNDLSLLYCVFTWHVFICGYYSNNSWHMIPVFIVCNSTNLISSSEVLNNAFRMLGALCCTCSGTKTITTVIDISLCTIESTIESLVILLMVYWSHYTAGIVVLWSIVPWTFPNHCFIDPDFFLHVDSLSSVYWVMCLIEQ